MINGTSQRSAATWFECGGTLDHYFTTYLLPSLSVKRLWKSVSIWQS